MKKVLLVCDDYTDLTNMQVELKRLGFDVFGVSNEARFNDNVISFNPDCVVAQGDSHLVSSMSVGRKIQSNLRFTGKVILILRQGYKPTAAELSAVRMDMLLEQPVDRQRLIVAIARLLNLDDQALLLKYSKVRNLNQAPAAAKKSENGAVPSAGDSAVAFEDKARSKKYEKFLGLKIDKTQSSHQRQGIRQMQKNLQKRFDFKFLEQLDILRRQFTKALFKKSN